MKSRKVIKWMNSSSNFDLNRFIYRLYKSNSFYHSICLDCNEDERIDSIWRFTSFDIKQFKWERKAEEEENYVTYSL